jgi:hypothetical protein
MTALEAANSQIWTNSPKLAAQQPIWWRRLPLLLLFGALFFTILPSWNLGFVSDDYGHLVEAATFSPVYATDGLHRPLRNIVFKIAFAAFGLNAVPYHAVLIALHLVVVALLYRFVLLLNASRCAAFIAALLFGFFPRNHQSIFWIAAAQDSVVGICLLISCSAFLHYRRTGRRAEYVLALLSFAVALGFKETAVAILPLLLLLDITFGRRNADFKGDSRWKIYLPFLLVAGLYLIWVFGEKWFGAAGVPQRYYGFQDFSHSLKLAAKFVLNMLVPFSPPVEVKGIFGHAASAVAVSAVIATIAIASFTLLTRRQLSLAVGWILIAMAPTAGFGLYTDRYLFMPVIGMALLLGFIGDAVALRVKTSRSAWPVVGVAGVASLYLCAAVPCLLRYQQSWRQAAHEIQATIDETKKLHPVVPNRSVFYFVNLTHSTNQGQVYVFNTSLNGALWAGGYDRSVTGQRTFSSDSPAEEELTQQLLECPHADRLHATLGNYVLVHKDRLTDVGGDCADRLVATSRARDPELWK